MVIVAAASLGHAQHNYQRQAPSGKRGRMSTVGMASNEAPSIDNGVKGMVKSAGSYILGFDEYGEVLIEAALTTSQPEDTLLQAFVKRKYFRNAVNVVIFANAVQLGLAADIRHGRWVTIWLACDHLFTMVYASEMVLSIAAFRWMYFHSRWLLFDFTVAMISVFDTWLLPIAGVAPNVGFMRALKLLRLLRIVKLTRAVPEVTAIVEGLLNSMASMFWVVFLAFLMLYAIGICCVQVVGHADSGYPSYSESDQDIHRVLVDNFNNYIYFGTVFRSIYTLFGIVLLSEWSLIRPVAELHPEFVPMFYLALIMVTFGVLNVMIGIVVEKTTEAIQKLRAEKEEQVIAAQQELCTLLADMLFDLDTDGDQTLSREEFEEGLKDARMVQVIEELGLPLSFTSVEFFNMLDVDGSGLISKHELINGILRLLYCDPFQRDCMLSMRFGTVQQSFKRLKAELLDEVLSGINEACRGAVNDICRDMIVCQEAASRMWGATQLNANSSTLGVQTDLKVSTSGCPKESGSPPPQISPEDLLETLCTTTSLIQRKDAVSLKEHQDHADLILSHAIKYARAVWKNSSRIEEINETSEGGQPSSALSFNIPVAHTPAGPIAHWKDPSDQTPISPNDVLLKVSARRRAGNDGLGAAIPTDECRTLPHELFCRVNEH